MNHLQKRLEGFADEVKQAGMSGASMQDKVAEIVGREDLSENEVRRIVEMSNRDVQLGLYKQAEDKRFVFDLAHPGDAVKHARANAEASTIQQSSKVAAIEEAGGDPFAPLDTDAPAKFSLYEARVGSDLIHEKEAAETREMTLKLAHIHDELKAVLHAGKQADMRSIKIAQESHDDAVQAAVDLLSSGIKLPDLYIALRAAVSGGEYNTPETVKATDDLASLILSGLKQRGIPNHRLGFAFKGDLDELDGMSQDAILALAKRAAGLPEKGLLAGDICMQTCKEAQRFMLSRPKPQKPAENSHPFEDAAEWLNIRPSQKDHPVPAATLDAAVVSHDPNGKVRAVNGDSEFVIAVKNLVGEQKRLGRSHAAQEYLGLKIKQIEDAIGKLQGAQKVADAEFEQTMAEAEEAKEAFLPALLAAGRAALPMLARGAAAVGRGAKAVGGAALRNPGTTLDVASGVASVMPKKPAQPAQPAQPAGAP
jgi:hypothetical protein